jgi:PAS domain S-box-containing protein
MLIELFLDMRLRLVLFLVLVTLLASSSAFAQTGAGRAEAVVLSDGQDKYPLGLHLEILRDPSREITIREVTSADYQDQFTPSQVEAPNFGFQKAVYWARFQVRNQAEQNSSWVLELDFVNMHYVDLYLPSPDGVSYEVKEAGVMRPYENRDFPFRRQAFKLEIPRGSEQTVYMRFQNEASMTLPLTLWSRGAFTNYMLLDQLVFGIFFGAMIVMAVYNLLLWYAIKERTYLYLVLFIVNILGSNFLYRGIAYQFVRFNSPWLATSLLLVFLGLEIYFLLRFTHEFLNIKTISPRLHRASQVYGVLILATIILAPFGPYQLIGPIQLFLATILLIAIVILTVSFGWAGSRPARYLIFSWIFFFFTGILFSLTRLGLISSTPFTEEFSNYALIWMVAVWSVALADQVNTLKEESASTNRQLQESESRLLQFLEAMPVGVVVYGTDLKPRYINRETKRLLTNPSSGVSPDMSLQRSLQQAIDYFSFRVAGTDQPYPLKKMPAIRAMREGRPTETYDIEINLGDQRIPTESWASPLFNASGEVEGAIVAFRDIRERLEKEALLHDSEARYRRLVETMNEGLGVSDDQDRFSYVNPRLAEMLGYAQDEMIGRPMVEFFNQKNRAIIADQLARRRAGEEQPYTLTWCRKDGRDLHTLVAPAVVFDQKGKYLRSIAVVTDISEQVKASELLDQLVAKRTHEISTLMEVSRAVASTLELEPLLQVILEELKSVVDFEGAAIYSIEDRHLSTLNFPLLVEKKKAVLLAEPLIREISQDERAIRSQAFIISDLQANTEDALYFRRIGADFLDFNSGKMRSWMGIPLKFKDKLVGILSVHHHLVDYYTPKDANLAFALANQTAVTIENARLYRQARTAAASIERSRLARELHDSVTQALYCLTLYAEATRAALRAGKVEVAEKHLDEVVIVAREGMGDLRLLIFELRPPVLDEEGLVGALRVRLETVESRAGIKTELLVDGKPNLPDEVEKEVYWSMHEALNNVLKHARAENVSLNLRFQNGSATVILQDDGVGYDISNPNQSNGMGLKNITERVERLGGDLRIESSPGEGTLVRIELEL